LNGEGNEVEDVEEVKKAKGRWRVAGGEQEEQQIPYCADLPAAGRLRSEGRRLLE
jgi:hypothetical protein